MSSDDEREDFLFPVVEATGSAVNQRLSTHSFVRFERYGTSWQCLIMLMVALDEGGGGSKQIVLSYIKNNHWFDLQQEDFQSYLSQDGGQEPRWETLIAFARKHLAIRGWLCVPTEHNHWQLNTVGKSLSRKVKASFANHVFYAEYCYLFSPTFKAHLNPRWQPSSNDTRRPRNMYRDWETIERFEPHPQLELFALFDEGEATSSQPI
jgi:hypothetical protein